MYVPTYLNCGPELARGRLTASRARSGGLLPRARRPCVGVSSQLTSTLANRLFALISKIFLVCANTSRTTLRFLRLSSNLASWLRLCHMARYDL